VGALTITTLGAPRVLHDGVPCEFLLRKVFALALYLAVTGQAHTRAQLVALLWPEADEAHGLLSLRQTLLQLRRVLGSDADQHLRTTGDLVRLDLGNGGIVDVALFAAAATSPDPSPPALQRYAGAFLAHLELDDAPDFMEWVTAQRAYWDVCFDRLAEHELRRLLDDGRAEEANALGQTWVARRTDSEAAYRLLATAQAAVGDADGARLTIAAAARRWAELGLELPAETQVLRARLTQLAALPAMLPPPPARVLRLPFVGRHEAFADLRQAYGRARDGAPGTALVLGEAGVGKSRLLGAFLRWARVQGADVAIGRADELSGRLPYQPLMELLRERLARERAPDDLVEDSWLSELQRLVPDLHDRYPDLPPPVDDSAAGTRLLEAIAQLGLALARHQPLVWVVDDLQWADEATRDALLCLLKRWRDARASALLVCTLRSEELATAPALEHWLAVARRTTTLTEVRLSPLSAELTAQAVTTLLGASASGEACAWLYAETGGNPLYLEHVLQALVERGVVRWQDNDQPRLAPDAEVAALESWLPETLRELLLQRVRRLNPAAQQMLAAAAVVGTHFDEGLLVPVAGVEEEAVLAALELAERRLLLRSEGGHYRFAHDKVAEAVYGDLTLARRRVFHRRALRALETAGDASAAELARHALVGEEWEAAARYSEQAAKAAQQIGAHRDAVRFYEQVVHLLTTAPSQEALRSYFSEEAVAHVYDQLALRHAVLGEKEAARAVCLRLLTEARTRQSRFLEGRLLDTLGRLAQEFDHDPAAAQTLLEDAQRLAEQTGDIPGQVRTTRRLALLALNREQMPQARAYAQHAVALARRSPKPSDLPIGLNVLSDVEMWSGRWEAACAAIEESIVRLATVLDEDTTADSEPHQGAPYQFLAPLPWATFVPRIAALLHATPTDASNHSRQWGSNGLMWMGIGRLHLGEGDTGRAALQMGCQIFTERNEQRFLHYYLLFRTLGWIEVGEYERARQETRQTMAAASNAIDRPIDPTGVRPWCAVVDATQALFQLAETREPLDQASAFAPDKPIWERLLPATRWCTQHALAGDWAAAYDAAREAQALRDAMPSPLTWFDFARYYETEALLRAGDRARAEADMLRLGEHLGTNRRYRLIYLRMQALLDRAAGAHTAAIAHVVEALDLATQMGLPGEEWQLAAELAASYTAVEDPDHAAEARLRAEQVVATLAANITDPTLSEHFRQAALSRRPGLD
jgi:DNA-binding SARP family transcriptional activator